MMTGVWFFVSVNDVRSTRQSGKYFGGCVFFLVRDLWSFTLEVVRHLTQSLLVLLKMVNLAALAGEVAGAFGHASVTTFELSSTL